MYLPAQWYEGILPLSDACIFVKVNEASCKGKILQRVEHHSWGGPFVAENMCFFSAQSNKKAVPLGPGKFCFFSPNILWTTSLSISWIWFFPHPTILPSWIRVEKGTPFPLMKRFIMAIVYVSPRAMVWRNLSSFWCLHLCKGEWGWGQLQGQDLAAGRTPFVGGTLCGRKHVLL